MTIVTALVLYFTLHASHPSDVLSSSSCGAIEHDCQSVAYRNLYWQENTTPEIYAARSIKIHFLHSSA